MKNKEYISIKKMIEYIDKALRYTKDCNFERFSKNEEKVDGTVFANYIKYNKIAILTH